MADLEPIHYPEHLNQHSLTEQELASLSPAQQAMAKDWNILRRQMEWNTNQLVRIHNILVEHDKSLEIWKRVIWLGSVVISISGIVLAIIKLKT